MKFDLSIRKDKIISRVYLADCMDFMSEVPDKFFELAIVDIPYGIESKISKGGNSHSKSSVKFHQLYSENGKKWDKASTPEYFAELSRVSVNQIIFGANYYNMPACRCFLVYDKPEMRIHTMSNCEYAWTSFDSPARIFQISRGFNCTIGIHPTQKPIRLYERIIKEYAKPGDKIFDSHLGSMSSRIAAYHLGFDFWGTELDPDYFKDGCERFERECHDTYTLKSGEKIKQQSLF